MRDPGQRGRPVYFGIEEAIPRNQRSIDAEAAEPTERLISRAAQKRVVGIAAGEQRLQEVGIGAG